MDDDAFFSQFSLWDHQIEAIKTVRRYTSEYQKGRTSGAALVHMPTGSGKTGVIAVLSRCVPEINCTLVLAPRVALRTQLFSDLEGRFFKVLERKPKSIPKQVVMLTGTMPALPSLDQPDGTVFISTIQKIYSTAQRDPQWFSSLLERTSLVIVDEGHYEPALSWSKVIRNFKCPKVLFTATPYRNDLKIFDLDLNYTYSFTFNEAVQKNFLRPVRFISMEPTNDPQAFIDDILKFYDETFDTGIENPPRTIIRCDRRASIRQIADSLITKGRSCVAIHERFEQNEERPWERKQVPDPSNEHAIFWIHQFKLLEGIDDSRFQLLALFEPLGTARSLVQQVGRIVRNPKQSPSEIGYVIDHSGGIQLSLWEGYLDYDNELMKAGPQALNLSVGQGLIPQFLSVQPNTTYIDGRFRRKFSLEEFDPASDLQIPLRVNLLVREEGFDLRTFQEFVSREYSEEDREFRLINIDESTFLVIYISYQNSPFLRTSCFMECRLGVTIVREMGNMIAYYDSTGRIPINYMEAGIGGAINPAQLRRLFRKGLQSRLTNVGLRNSNLGISNIRSRSLTAASLEEIAPALDDYAQICTIIEGYSDETEIDLVNGNDTPRRYLGFGNGRVTQASTYCSLHKYFEWLNNLQVLMLENNEVPQLFNRYALEDTEPEIPAARNILLDLSEVNHAYFTVGGREIQPDVPMEIEDLCQDVVGGEFILRANGVDCRVQIEYDANRKRYHLESPDLETIYRSNDPILPQDLITYINRNQTFRIIPQTENVLYILGNFYRPLLKFGAQYGRDHIELDKLLIDIPVLENISSEKGTQCKNDNLGWEENSLFDIIDTLGRGYDLERYFDDPDVLICDDMGTEIADFILCDSLNAKVVLIHAKASRTRRLYSASSLQEVCSQATKNIRYLSWANTDLPPNINLWDRSWHSPHVRGEVNTRIRRGEDNPDELWGKVRGVIRDPSAEKEVWLFLGQTLSRNRFLEQLSLDNPGAEAIQAAYLMHSTWESVSSVGGKLRIFCFP